MRSVYFVSDSTGITAQTVGRSLLSQFPGEVFEHHTFRYVNSMEQAQEVTRAVKTALEAGKSPIIFSTLVDDAIRAELVNSGALYLDLFGAFIAPMESYLSQTAAHSIGRSHSVGKPEEYEHRIDAVNFALNSDDGLRAEHYDQADAVLIGVSRSGKTPTSLYLALQYGLFVANYPLTEEDLGGGRLPTPVQQVKDKVVGLTITAERLQAIRQARRPDSPYANLAQCRQELQQAEGMMRAYSIPILDVTRLSVEEIAARVLLILGREDAG